MEQNRISKKFEKDFEELNELNMDIDKLEYIIRSKKSEVRSIHRGTMQFLLKIENKIRKIKKITR